MLNHQLNYHLSSTVLERSEISRGIVGRLVRFARRLAACVDEVRVHNEVVSGPKVIPVLPAARSGV